MKPANISNQRIMAEMKKLNIQKLQYLKAGPLADDLYTWHFTFLGPQNTQFHEGLYHGQILLPYQYPFKPPDIVFMNKNGRFQTNTKICLTITQYHPEQWNSAWTIRTMLEAVISLFIENVQGVGSLASSADVRQFLAKQSQNYVCEKCGPLKDLIKHRPPYEHKPEQKKQEKAVELIQRKKSEAVEAKKMPSLEHLISEQLNRPIRERREDHRQKNTQRFYKYPTKSSNIQPQQRQIHAQQQTDSRHQVIYVRGNNDDCKSQLKFRYHAKQIQQNIQILDDVFKSMKWV